MSDMLAPVTKPKQRRRSSSVTDALKQIPLNQGQEASVSSEVKPLPNRPRPRKKHADDLPELYHSLGFWKDLKTGRWMLIPSSSFKILLIPIILYANHRLLAHFGIIDSSVPNIFATFILPSNRLPNGKYAKAKGDVAFVAYYIVFWSFVRQFMTIEVLRPLGKRLGIKGEAKLMRFTEQGYALFYFGILGTWGVYVMSGLSVWWYRTEEIWIGYPHKEMPMGLKTYYLAELAYWLQQMIILVAKIEKPRKDFKELVAHHLVSLWLIIWSYNMYLTYIGICVYISMDVSDIFLALAKCINYVSEPYSAPPFAFFVGVWTYFRHYLNLWILWSVWYQFDLIPLANRSEFAPWRDIWMPPWMKPVIFWSIASLQVINLFWYFLIWRVLLRALFSKDLHDDRSDDEGEDEANISTTDKVKMLHGDKEE